MKEIEVSVADVKINPALMARKAAPNPDDVQYIAHSMLHRAEAGIEPIQIMPGIVRSVDGVYELMDGRNRLEAIKAVNEAGGVNGEELRFRVVIVRSAEDVDGLVTAVQANIHVPMSVFDRASSMARLIELGKTQAEVASIFGVSPQTTSQMLKLANLPKKYVKAIEAGDVEQDAAILLADLDTDPEKQQQIFEEAIRHRQRVEDIMVKLENKKAKEEASSKIEESKNAVAEAEAKVKEQAKVVKELEKTAAKTKDIAELEAVRAKMVEEKKALKAVEKEAAAAAKLLEKAKAEKEKVVQQSAPKKKVTAEDVKQAAKEKGVDKLKGNAKNKEGKKIGPTPRTKADLVAALEAMPTKENPLPEPAARLAGKIQEFLDGECTQAEFEKSFRFYTRDEMPKKK